MKIALATLIALSACTPAIADEYQPGYSSSRTCFREEYREEYVPGTSNDPGYVRSWQETIEYPCRRSRIERTPENTTRTRRYEEYDENDCSEGTIAGALLGGGLAGFGSRGKDRWWAIPSGAIVGGIIGCDIDGG